MTGQTMTGQTTTGPLTADGASHPTAPRLDTLAAIGIAALAAVVQVTYHEAIHALTARLVGCELREFTALHVSCDCDAVWKSKVVAGSAAVANVVLGTLLWVAMRRSDRWAGDFRLFGWLLVLMNWLGGAGYWMFSGIANVGDWATVIAGWQPHGAWRVGMSLAGAAVYTLFTWLATHELGRILGGTPGAQVAVAAKFGLIAYLTSASVAFSAGLFHPQGISGLPAVAALMAALGAMSPLIWLPQWFRADHFAKRPGPPAIVDRRWPWLAAGAAAAFVYAVVLGRGIRF